MDNAEMSLAIAKLREDVDRAQKRADEAMSAGASHEILCALRYETISKQLAIIPQVFNKIDAMSSRLNIATGVWVGVLGIGGFVGIAYTIIKMAHGG